MDEGTNNGCESDSISWADRNQMHVIPLIDKSKEHRKGPGKRKTANAKAQVPNDKKRKMHPITF